MSQKRDIQWYPGHMAKAVRQMKDQMKLVDLVIEVLDARIPASSRNPQMDQIAQGKMRMILLSKADLAREALTREWVAFYEKKGYKTLAIDARRKKDI